MADVPSISTERLVLRACVEHDLDAYAGMCADPEVMRYLGDGQPPNRKDAWRQMALFIGHWALRGYGLWAIESKSDGRLIGRAGLWRPEGWPGLELGWALARASWGRG